MESYTLHKVDTRLYVQGFSGVLVFKALYAVLTAFLLFVILYIFAGTFPAAIICIPLFFGYLHRLSRIQKDPGPEGWQKQQTSRKLPGFILIKKRLHQIHTS